MVTIQAYKIKELANLYKVSYHTFWQWIKKIEHHFENNTKKPLGQRMNGYYTPAQVERIIEHLGAPGKEI